MGGGLQVLKVRIETSSGDGSAESSGVLGSIGAIRDRSSGLPTRAETRILALAADQIALSLRRDQLRREATDVEIARQGDALKTALIDSVSHDLRTPLASIRATAGGLMDPAVPVTEGSTRAAARVIDEEAARLDHLVRAVLDLSRIEAGALRPELEPHDLRDLVEAVVARTAHGRARAHDRGLPSGEPARRARRPGPAWTSSWPTCSTTRSSTRRRRRPCGSRPGSPPTGGSTSTSRTAVKGVPREALPHLFDRFYRVPGSGSGARKGLGIGLSIVRGLVEAMGGTVAATDEPARRPGRPS